MGGKLKYINKSEDLPLNFKISSKYMPGRFLRPPNLLLDINIPSGQKVYFNAGPEIWLNEAVALRCGYRDKVEEGKFLGGIGFRTEIFQLDYAYMWTNELENAHRFSATFRFSGDKQANQYTESKKKILKTYSPNLGDKENIIKFEQNKRTIKFDNELKDEILFLTPMNTIK